MVTAPAVANHASALKRHRQTPEAHEAQPGASGPGSGTSCATVRAGGRRPRRQPSPRTPCVRATRALDKAVTKGVIHRNNAARRVAAAGARGQPARDRRGRAQLGPVSIRSSAASNAAAAGRDRLERPGRARAAPRARARARRRAAARVPPHQPAGHAEPRGRSHPDRAPASASSATCSARRRFAARKATMRIGGSPAREQLPRSATVRPGEVAAREAIRQLLDARPRAADADGLARAPRRCARRGPRTARPSPSPTPARARSSAVSLDEQLDGRGPDRRARARERGGATHSRSARRIGHAREGERAAVRARTPRQQPAARSSARATRIRHAGGPTRPARRQHQLLVAARRAPPRVGSPAPAPRRRGAATRGRRAPRGARPRPRPPRACASSPVTVARQHPLAHQGSARSTRWVSSRAGGRIGAQRRARERGERIAGAPAAGRAAPAPLRRPPSRRGRRRVPPARRARRAPRPPARSRRSARWSGRRDRAR